MINTEFKLPSSMEELSDKIARARKDISSNSKTYKEFLRKCVPISLNEYSYCNLSFTRLSYYGLCPWPNIYSYEDWKNALDGTILELETTHMRKASERTTLDSLLCELKRMALAGESCEIFEKFNRQREKKLNKFIYSFQMLYWTMERSCPMSIDEIGELWRKKEEDAGICMLDQIIHECINQCNGYSQSVYWIKEGLNNLAKEHKYQDWKSMFMDKPFDAFYSLVLSETIRAKKEMAQSINR